MLPRHAHETWVMSERPAADALDGGIYRQRFSVAFEYDVFVTRGVFDPQNRVLLDALCRREPTRRHRLYCVVDDGVARAFPGLGRAIASYCSAHDAQLELLEEPRIVPGGERSKTSPELIESLQHDLYRLGVDRQSFVLAIGGGAMLDAVGYAAATTHRGVRIVRLPTTVLGQNDSGVGVKNSVNAYGAKNFLGTFAPPFAVINDTEFLSTLEPRDRRSGMAEAVKVALIRDPVFFAWLEAHVRELRAFEPSAVDYLVRRAGEIHLRHIGLAGDPFERGSARPLDFGHWAAHKLESLCDHELRHGEAVAIGMALDSRYGASLGMLSEAELERILRLLEALGFALWHPALAQLDANEQPAVLAGLREFREHLGGELTVTLLRAIGQGVEVHEIDPAGVVAALRFLEARHARADHAA
jgi:3-dehydroquinate synthase